MKLPTVPVKESGLISPAVPLAAPSFHWIATLPGTAFPARLGPPGPGNPGTPLPGFVSAVASASQRIWIIDRHFEGWCGLAQLLEVLLPGSARRPLKPRGTAPVVMILSRRVKEARDWLTSEKKGLPQNIRIAGLRDDASVHDRFALVDDDLWHFGSTVGGAHPEVSAATRGWGAEVPLFERLFQSLWEKATS